MSETNNLVTRHSVPLSGGSCDMRIGPGALERLGREMRIVAGRPHRAVMAAQAGTDPERIEEARRLMTDAGFTTVSYELPAPADALDAKNLLDIWSFLDSEGLTSGDVMVAMGGVEALSLADHACAAWCDDMPVAFVPADIAAAVEAPPTPRALAINGSEGMVNFHCRASLCMCDPTAMVCDGQAGAYFRALACATAVADSAEAFSKLATRASDLVACDTDALCAQIADTVRGRGRVISSTSVAVRQAIEYGVICARALAQLVPDCDDPARLLAEGLRIQARLAIAAGDGDVDFVFAQDALLDELGLEEVPCHLEAPALIEAVKAQGLKRSNRFMFAVPLKLGRVRLASLEDDVLQEHLGAWCQARARLATRLGV